MRSVAAAGALHAPVAAKVSASFSDPFLRIAQLVLRIVRRRAVGCEAVEEVALPVGVAQGEGDRRDQEIAERDPVLTDRLAVGGAANHDDRHERPERVDHELARRRRTARRHDDQPIEPQLRRLGVEPQDAVAKRVPVVVEVLGEDEALGALSADVARQVLRDVDQAAAVVAEVEHEVVDPLRRELGERAVERLEDGWTKLRKKM